MPIRASGEGSLNEIDRWDGGAGWIAFPDEDMQRASHALVIDSAERSSAGSQTQSGDGEVWVVDPVDVPGLDEWLAAMGEVAGVVVLLDRHQRDAAEIANRHAVSVHIPAWMRGVADEFVAPVERLGDTLGPYEVRRLVDTVGWQEAALYDPEAGTLLVPEALGTVGYYLAGAERVGVHPMLRLVSPPRSLVGLDVERLLVGHGDGVAVDARAAITDAVTGARRRAPAAYLRAAKEFIAR
jgi:hypothetical protein